MLRQSVRLKIITSHGHSALRPQYRGDQQDLKHAHAARRRSLKLIQSCTADEGLTLAHSDRSCPPAVCGPPGHVAVQIPQQAVQCETAANANHVRTLHKPCAHLATAGQMSHHHVPPVPAETIPALAASAVNLPQTGACHWQTCIKQEGHVQ
jgi:hypothetical protein